MKKLLPGFFDGWTKTRFPEGKGRALKLDSYEVTLDLSTVARLLAGLHGNMTFLAQKSY